MFNCKTIKHMAAKQINKIILRQKMAEKEIFSFSELARRVDCSETAIHGAIERPSRFSNVVANIVKILKLKSLDDLIENGAKKLIEAA